MTKADAPKFAECLAVLSETFNEPVSELRAEAYFSALEDLPIEAVVEAVKQAIRSLKFFPRPVELREYVQGSLDDQSIAAWSEVLSEVRRVGYCGQPMLQDPTAEAVRLVWGSWRQLCETLPNDGPERLGWMKQFRSAYVGTVRRFDGQHYIGTGEARALLAQLTGTLPTRRRDEIQ